VVRSDGGLDDVPPSLLDVLLSRVDALSPGAQKLLRTASVAGRAVSDRLLADVAGIPEAEFYTTLRETVENHLLVVDPSGYGYTFRHALTRDAVYEDMLPGERVRLHAAYGEALERDPRLASDAAALPATLAYHWYAALDLPRALRATVDAARAALTSYGPAEALRHLERALEIWPRVADAEQRTGLDQVEVSRLAADAAYRSGALDRAQSLIADALAELPAGARPERRACSWSAPRSSCGTRASRRRRPLRWRGRSRCCPRIRKPGPARWCSPGWQPASCAPTTCRARCRPHG